MQEDKINNIDYIYNNAEIQLINKGKNKEILEKAPNMDYLDCSLIIKLIERDNDGNIIFEKFIFLLAK